MKVEFHPLFWSDIRKQALYIENESNLGKEFLDAVLLGIDSIKKNPGLNSYLYNKTRHLILRKFKRHVIHYEYLEEKNLIRF